MGQDKLSKLSLNRSMKSPDECLILLEMQHRDGIHAFKMADKIAGKEGHRQRFVEYLSEMAHN